MDIILEMQYWNLQQILSSVRQWFSTREDSVPQETSENVWQQVDCVSTK